MTYEKFTYVKINSPSHLQDLLKTIKNKSGPIKGNIQWKHNIEAIYATLVSLHLQGSRVLEIWFDLENIKQHTCLVTRLSLQNIEKFKARVRVIQKMRVLKNLTGELVNQYAIV